MVNRGSLSTLNERAGQLNVLLIRLHGEMKDISLRGEFGDFFVEGGSTLVEFFFDNAFTDAVPLDRIHNLSERLGYARKDVLKAQVDIEKVKKEYARELDGKQKELKELIVEFE